MTVTALCMLLYWFVRLGIFYLVFLHAPSYYLRTFRLWQKRILQRFFVDLCKNISEQMCTKIFHLLVNIFLNHLPHVCHEPCPKCIFLLLKQNLKNHVFCGWYAAWSRYEHQIVFCPALHEWIFFLREKPRTWYRNVNGFVRWCADRCKSAIFLFRIVSAL